MTGPKDRDKETQSERIAYLRRKFHGKSVKERCLTPSDLPSWAKRAIAMHDTIGMTWKQVMKQFKGKSERQLSAYISSPGGKAYRAAIKSVTDDPIEITRKVAAHDAPHLLYLAYEHLAICQEAGDLAEYGRTLRALVELTGAPPPKTQAVQPIAPVINITMPAIQGGTVVAEIPHGESEHKLLPAEIVTEEPS